MRAAVAATRWPQGRAHVRNDPELTVWRGGDSGWSDTVARGPDPRRREQARGYVVAAVTVTDTEAVRKVVRSLALPGQRRLHMKHEQMRRRRIIVWAQAATEIHATVYDAARRYRTDRAARTACLTALVEDIAARTGDTQLVIEQDDSAARTDHDLFHLVRQAGIAHRLEYRHQRASDELLLALPDILAWSWVRSGEWRRRISRILTNVRTV